MEQKLNTEFDLQKILTLIKKNWKIFFTLGLVGILAGFLIANFLIAPKYTSQVKFLAYVKDEVSIGSTDTNSAISAANTNTTYTIKMIPSYMTLLKTNSFDTRLQQVANITGSIQGSVQYAQVDNTTIFIATVTTGNAHTSQTIANALTQCVPEFINEINELVTVKVVDAPSEGVEVGANKKLYCAAGLLAGLVLAFLYAFLRDLLDIHFKREEDIISRYETIPLLGVVPNFDEKSNRKGGGR